MNCLILSTFLALVVVACNGNEVCERDFIGENILNKEYQAKGLEICEKCMVEKKLQMKELEKVEEKRADTAGENVMCYFECYSYEIGTLKPVFHFDNETIAAVLRDDALAATGKCRELHEDETKPCQSAYRIYNCICETLGLPKVE